MYWMAKSVFWCVLTTIPAVIGNFNVSTKLNDESEYKILECEGNLNVLEDDEIDIKFLSDDKIDAILCRNYKSGSRLDFMEENPRPEEFVGQIIVDYESIGSWNCTLLIQKGQKSQNTVAYNGFHYIPEFCEFTVYAKFSLEFKLVRNEEEYYADDSDENTYMFKNGDDVQIFCSIPFMEDTDEPIGTLYWRHCYHETIYKNGSSKLQCIDSVRWNSNEIMNSSDWTLDARNDNDTIECIYESNDSLEELSILILLKNEPEEPPKFLVNSYQPYSTSTKNKYIYDGKVGETISVNCVNSQDLGTLHWVCCKRSICDLCNGVIHDTNEINIVITLDEDYNDRTVSCVYTSEFSVLSSNLVFIVRPNDNAVTFNVSATTFHTGDIIEITCANRMGVKSEVYFSTSLDDYFRLGQAVHVVTYHYTFNNSYVADYASYKMNFTDSTLIVLCVFSFGVEIYHANLHRITENPYSTFIYIGSSVAAMIIFILAIICYCKRKGSRKLPNTLQAASENEEEHVYYIMYK